MIENIELNEIKCNRHVYGHTGTDDVLKIFDVVRGDYPGAEVFTSTFDAFFEAIEPVRDQLPVVTNEVGDTWMYGAASDPLKASDTDPFA